RYSYISHATIEFNPELLQELAASSGERNAREGLTGFLTFHMHYFYQYVEGPETALRSLRERLQKDTRHTIQDELSVQPIESRLFLGWNMKYLEHEQMQTFFTAENLAANLVEDVITPQGGLRSVWEWKVEQIANVVARTMQHV
ncbi:MAG: BLUF domain-containing protein, partial [Lacipirellulaceae bacterium]